MSNENILYQLHNRLTDKQKFKSPHINSRDDIYGTTIFLILSAITGYIEIGSVIFSIIHDLSINQILMIVIAYQIGCFFPSNLQLSKLNLLFSATTATGLFTYISIFQFNYTIFWIATVLISLNLQSLRGLQKAVVSTGIKRTFRIIGFCLSPFYTLTVIPIFLVFMIIRIFSQKNEFIDKIYFPCLKFHDYVMIFHQMHYFVYSYIVIILIMLVGGYNAYYASVAFVLGWITYTAVSYILDKKKYLQYFFVGHISLAIILLLMAIVNSIELKAIFWIFTGFGGGTVFCIEKIQQSYNDLNRVALTFSENIGHVVGLAFSILVYNLTQSYNAVIFVASFFAALAAFLMFIYFNIKQWGKNKI